MKCGVQCVRIKSKLVVVGISLGVLLSSKTLHFFSTSSALESELDAVVSLTESAVSSTSGAESTLNTLQSRFTLVSSEIESAVEPLGQNNQRIEILERKSVQISERLVELQDTLGLVAESLPEDGDALYDTEDAIDELSDIQQEVRRELIAALQQTKEVSIQVSGGILRNTQALSTLRDEMSGAFTLLLQNNTSNVANNQNAINKTKAMAESYSVNAFWMRLGILFTTTLVAGSLIYIYKLFSKPIDAIQSLRSWHREISEMLSTIVPVMNLVPWQMPSIT